MVGQFKNAFLHRPIKILHFLTPARIQKCLTKLQNMLAFLTVNHHQDESRICQGIFSNEGYIVKFPPHFLHIFCIGNTLMKVLSIKIYSTTSNVIEVIRPILNYFFCCCFFLQTDFTRTKSTKKHQKALKRIKST